MSTTRTAAARLTAAAAVSALAVTATAGPAAADTASFRDGRGDITQGADIRKVRVVNGPERLVVKVTHRDLVRSFRSGSSISVYLDTDPAKQGPEYVFVGGTFSGADYALIRADGFEPVNRRQVPLRGGTAEMDVDYASDVARIRIDQVVLRDPQRVRVEVTTGAELTPPGGGAPSTEVDWLGTPETFTPWVARG